MKALFALIALEGTAAAQSASIVWTPGRIDPAPEVANEGSWSPVDEDAMIAPAPLASYEQVMRPLSDASPHSRELSGLLGVIGAGVAAPASVSVLAQDEQRERVGLAIEFMGVAISSGALAVAAIAAPTMRGLRSDLEQAKGQLPDEELAAAEFERAFSRAVARERTVRKVAAIVELGGAATIVSGLVVSSVEKRGGGLELAPLAVLFGTLGVNDLVRPWELETRYHKVRTLPEPPKVRVSAVPLPGGAAVGLGGTF